MSNNNSNINNILSDYNKIIYENDILKSKLSGQSKLLTYYSEKYSNIANSTIWKMTAGIRWILDFFHGKNKYLSYTEWKKRKSARYFYSESKLSKKDRTEFKKIFPGFSINFATKGVSLGGLNNQINNQTTGPLISIIVPLFNTKSNYLTELIDSVNAQTYKNWELCFGDASDSDYSYLSEIVNTYSKSNKKIKYFKIDKNLGISANTNLIFPKTNGSYYLLLDHDDLLHPCALYLAAQEIMNGADFIYSDELVFYEDNINDVVDILHKPDFDWYTFRSHNYLCHMSVFSKELFLKAGGCEYTKYDGSQDYDLFLRMLELTDRISHIPHILYYWRSHEGSISRGIDEKSGCVETSILALSEHLKRTNIDAIVTSPYNDSHFKIQYNIHDKHVVSIIVDNVISVANLKICINSIIDKSTWSDFEIIIIDNRGLCSNNSFPSNIRLIHGLITDNYDMIIQKAIDKATGDAIILLDSNLKVMSPSWIEEMLMFTEQRNVGIIGPLILSNNNCILHAGITLNSSGIYYNGYNEPWPLIHRLGYIRSVAAVSGNCMMFKKDTFEHAFSNKVKIDTRFFDVDLCLSVRNIGASIIYTPYARLQSINNKMLFSPYALSGTNKESYKTFLNKWELFFSRSDPFYNINYLPSDGNWSLSQDIIC